MKSLHQLACVVVLLATVCAAVANNDGAQVMVPSFLREPRDTFVAQSRRAVLSCQVASYSTTSKLLVRIKDSQRVSIIWLLNGTVIASSRQKEYSVTNFIDQSSLTVLNFRQSAHQGRYQCVANFTYGSVISRPAFLRQANVVWNAEQSTIEENTITMTVGNTAFISCTSPFSVSVPKAEVVGYELNGAALTLTSRHLVTSDGNLVVAAVQQADQGSYRCRFANVPMNISRLSRNVNILRVIDPKRDKDGPAPRSYALKTPQSSVVSVVGQNVTIECVFVGMPPPRTVWEFAPPGESQRQVSQSSDGRIVVSSGVLQIANVQAEDEGVYSCSSIDSRSVPQYANLRVNKPPFFESEAAAYQLTTAKAGARVELDCGASEATRWTWYQDGVALPSSGQSGNKYVLSAVTMQSAGVYQCLAENAHGSAFKTIRMTVTTGSRNVYQIVQLPNNRSVSLDELAVFACVASGNLKEGAPSWMWLKDGRPLPNDSRILAETQNELTSSIQIYNVKQSDAGSYTCVLLDAGVAVAKNGRATAWLTVETQQATTTPIQRTQQSTSQRKSKPPKRRMTTAAARSTSSLESARTEIYIVVLNSTSLSVSWTHAEPVTKWLYGTAVWYRAINSTDAQNERKFVTSDVTNYILTNLLPDTKYQVWVVAQQQNGDKASPSDLVEVKTMSDERNSLDDGSYSPHYDDETSNEEDGQTMEIDVEELIGNSERSNSQVADSEQHSEENTASTLHNSPQHSGQVDASGAETQNESGNSRVLYILLVSLVCAALLLVGSTVAFLFLRARARGYRKASAKNKESSAKSPSAHSRVSDDNSILSYTRLPQTALTVNTSPACVNVNVGMVSETIDGDLHGDVDADGSFVLHATLARDGTLRTGGSNMPCIAPIGYIPMGSALNALSFVTARDGGAEQQHATPARAAGVFVSNFGDRYDSATCGPPKRTSIVLASPNGAFSALESGTQLPVFGHVTSANGYRTLMPTMPLNAAHPCNIATFLSNIRPPSVANSIVSSQRLNAPSVAQRRSTGQLTGSSSSLSNASCSDCQCSREDVNCNRECHHAWSKSPRLEAGQTAQQTAGQSSTLMRKRKHAKYRSARRKSTNQKEPGVTLKLDFPNNGALTTNLN